MTPEAGKWGLFEECSGVTSILFNNIDTSTVSDMNCMFLGCAVLEGLDLTKFDTSNVTNMREMFSGCKKISTLNISSFNTSKVECMSSMFVNCNSLSELDLSSFDTNNVTEMSGMFESNTTAPEPTSSLQKIIVDGNKFKTAKVFDPDLGDSGSGMFAGCNLLIGEAGSTLESVQLLDEDHYTDATHAIVDTDKTKSATAGYFTQKK